VNDLWDWNGTKWTKLATATSPDGRENSGLAYDALTNRMLLFGGYAGHYFGDIWQYDTATNSWQPLLRAETSAAGGERRRRRYCRAAQASFAARSSRDRVARLRGCAVFRRVTPQPRNLATSLC
jgi:hypothetical protein